MKPKQIPLPCRRLGTAVSLATLCLAVPALAPSAALADSPVAASTQFPVCQLSQAAFPPGFIVYATITNTTVGPFSNWSVSFTMASNTSVGTIFGGTVTPTATGGTITPLAYQATIMPGGKAIVGFTGSVSPFVLPADFTLNGQPCTSI